MRDLVVGVSRRASHRLLEGPMDYEGRKMSVLSEE